jgi:hypothetical protein
MTAGVVRDEARATAVRGVSARFRRAVRRLIDEISNPRLSIVCAEAMRWADVTVVMAFDQISGKREHGVARLYDR